MERASAMRSMFATTLETAAFKTACDIWNSDVP